MSMDRFREKNVLKNFEPWSSKFPADYTVLQYYKAEREGILFWEVEAIYTTCQAISKFFQIFF